MKTRTEGGKKLAEMLEKYRGKDPVILALPRGSLPVAYEIAHYLGEPFDVVISRKLGVPYNEEFGFGAVSEDTIPVINQPLIESLSLTDEDINVVIAKEVKEVERRIRLYRKGRERPDVIGKIVILVDDGLATGITALAAVRFLRTLKPKKIVLAAPVCSKETEEFLKKEADEVVCLYSIDNLMGVGMWYENFPQLTDQEVLDFLSKK